MIVNKHVFFQVLRIRNKSHKCLPSWGFYSSAGRWVNKSRSLQGTITVMGNHTVRWKEGFTQGPGAVTVGPHYVC